MDKTRVATVTRRKNKKGFETMAGAWGGVLFIMHPADPDEDGNERWHVYLRQRSFSLEELREDAREKAAKAHATARIRRRRADGVVELGGRD